MQRLNSLFSLVLAVSLSTLPMACGWMGVERPPVGGPTSSPSNSKTASGEAMDKSKNHPDPPAPDSQLKVELGKDLKIVVDEDTLDVDPNDQPDSTAARKGGRPASPRDPLTNRGGSDDREADATQTEDGESVEDARDIPRGRPASPQGGLRSLGAPDDSE